MGYHGRAAVSKPYITKCKAKCQIQWSKAHHQWALEQCGNSMDESGFGGWQENGTCLTALCQV